VKSKSEMKRLATTNPVKMAEEHYKLQEQLDSIAIPAIKRIADHWFDASDGGGCMGCEANQLARYRGTHELDCPFQVAHEAHETLKKLREGK
jgi:hypothetical protein